MWENENKNPFTKQVNLDWENSEENSAPDNPFKHLEEEKKPELNEKKPNKKKKKISVWSVLFWIFILFLFLAILLIFVLVIWWPNNPLLTLLWIQAATIQTSLLQLTNTIFTIFSIVVFIFLGFWIFARLLAKKEDKEKRRSALIISFSSWFLLFITMAAWIWLYSWIESFEFHLNIKAEITMEPSKTDKLVTPVIINFSALNAIIVSEAKWKEISNILWDFDNDWSYDYKWIEPNISHEFQVHWQKRVVVTFEYKDWSRQSFEKFFVLKTWSFAAKPDEWPIPLEVEFDASNLSDATVNPISEYRWFFTWWEVEDLVTSKPKAKYTFDKVWNYEVVLVTVDSKNNIQKYKKDINAKTWNWWSLLKPVIEILPWKQWSAPLKLKFSAESSTSSDWNIVSYEWDFWDLTEPISWKTVLKTFEKEWEYEVTLMVEDNSWQKKLATETVSVIKNQEAPIAVITIDKEALEWNTPFDVSFDASKSKDADNDIVEYNWDFDSDWKIDSTWEKVSFVYREPWAFTATLIVEDSEWNKWKDTVEFLLTSKKQAIITTDKNTWEAPLVVSFDASSTLIDKDDKIINYSWDFWDWILEEYSWANKTHKYTDPWKYLVKLIVSTENWEVYESEKEVFVREISLQSCFEASKTKWTAPTSIKFDSHCSRWVIENWHWDFWDWSISYQRSPVHEFNKAWEYDVKLQVTDEKSNVSIYKMTINLD